MLISMDMSAENSRDSVEIEEHAMLTTMQPLNTLIPTCTEMTITDTRAILNGNFSMNSEYTIINL